MKLDWGHRWQFSSRVPSSWWAFSRWEATRGGFGLGSRTQLYRRGRIWTWVCLSPESLHTILLYPAIPTQTSFQNINHSEALSLPHLPPSLKHTFHQTSQGQNNKNTNTDSLFLLHWLPVFINMIFNNNLKLNLNGWNTGSSTSPVVISTSLPSFQKAFPKEMGIFLSLQETGFKSRSFPTVWLDTKE